MTLSMAEQSSLRIRQHITFCSIALIVMCGFFIILLPKTNAISLDIFTDTSKAIMENVKEKPYDLVNDCLSLTGSGKKPSIYSYLVKDKKISAGYKILKGVGIVMVLFWLLTRIISEMTREGTTEEFWWRTATQLCFAIIVIGFGDYFIDNILNVVGEATVKFIQIALAPSDPSKTITKKSINGALGLLDAGGKLIKKIAFYNFGLFKLRMLAVEAFLLIPKLGVRIRCYSTIVELFIRRLFTPIAVADIAAEGFRGTGASWLKRYFGVYVRMAMYYAVAFMGSVFFEALIQKQEKKMKFTTLFSILSGNNIIIDNILMWVLVFGLMKGASEIASQVTNG